MRVRFEKTTTPDGVAVVDEIEGRRFVVETGESVDLRTVSSDEFYFPVDAGCSIETDSLFVDQLDDVYVRGSDGTLDTNIRSHQNVELTYGTHCIEICGPIKVYCRVTDSLELHTGADYLQIRSPAPTKFWIGARSYHEQPAATLTTTDDPRDMMQVISTLSSALKTTSVERSYPTLRGYPPLIDRGEELSIPDGLGPPDTDIKVVVPPEYRHIYTVAPLAFYLGAELVSGTPPRIETESGFKKHLASEQWFEDEVARVLKQIVFLDCVVRTEGYYQVDLYERRMIEPYLPFDIGELYGRHISEQLRQYMTVDFEVVEEQLPNWCLTAHIPASPNSIETIPHILNDLGVVRQPKGKRLKNPYGEAPVYTRGRIHTDGGTSVSSPGDTFQRSSDSDSSYEILVEPDHTSESIEHAWFGDHVPRGASKATLEAYEARLERQTRDDTIDIDVVCNDKRMIREQDSLDNVYGNRDDLPYSVDSYFHTSRDKLTDLFRQSDSDFLHFIGHAHPDGLECSDGRLDVRELDNIATDVFLLNACRSYHQALELTKRGAFGGIGTLSNVVNHQAVDIGHALANLLNIGFPLRAALSVIREHSDIGNQYIIVGDGNADVAQFNGGIPDIIDVSQVSKDKYSVSIRPFANRIYGVGTLLSPKLQQFSERFLSPGETNEVELHKSELADFLMNFTSPVTFDGKLYFNHSFEVPDFLNGY